MSKIKCLQCNEILESKHRHDFVGCGCPNETFVDGGEDYTRIGGKNLDLIAIINQDAILSWVRYAKDVPLDNQKRYLILPRGTPGSGKSTLAHKLKGNDGVVLSTDDFFMIDGEYRWSAEKMGMAHRWNQNRCRDAIKREIPIIVVDNTNLVAKEIKPYIDAVKNTDYGVLVVEPYNEHCRNAEVLFQRNKHGVPMETIQRMLAKEEPLRDFCAKIRGYLDDK